jgi:hypothetical protein
VIEAPLDATRDYVERMRRWQTCLHESGHYITAWRLGIPIERIVILDLPTPSGGLGFVRPLKTAVAPGERISRGERIRICSEPKSDLAVRQELARMAIFHYAGAAAAYNDSFGISTELCASMATDQEQFRDYARFFGRRVSFWSAWYRACYFVDCHFGFVLAVARALYERGELTGEEARIIAEGATPSVNCRDWPQARDRAPVPDSEWTLEPLAPEDCEILEPEDFANDTTELSRVEEELDAIPAREALTGAAFGAAARAAGRASRADAASPRSATAPRRGDSPVLG